MNTARFTSRRNKPRCTMTRKRTTIRYIGSEWEFKFYSFGSWLFAAEVLVVGSGGVGCLRWVVFGCLQQAGPGLRRIGKLPDILICNAFSLSSLGPTTLGFDRNALFLHPVLLDYIWSRSATSAARFMPGSDTINVLFRPKP